MEEKDTSQEEVMDMKEQAEEQEQEEKGNSEKAEENEENTDEKTDELPRLKNELAESKEKYLRLYSEFENFRRRTAKERLDLVQTANIELMGELISVLDDFERAERSFEKEEAGIEALKEGLELIRQKFKKVLEQKGLKPMKNEIGMDFDPDFHEAITQIPAPEEKLKGKVVDIIEKGYTLRDKVVRYAKVVTGN